ncbi:hypothetical protein QQF64_017843 [Cirrhinus molitorella]|uniref:Uncharacterized protein n=1 Tax=Cirrhinus molitorella TaxID=172907 RepID=A0ABR3LLE4_9TELE
MMGRFGKKGRYSCFGFLAVLLLLLPYAMARACTQTSSGALNVLDYPPYNKTSAPYFLYLLSVFQEKGE